MFCKNCGAKVEGVKKFCKNCGTAFSVADTIKPKAVIRPPMPKEKWTVAKVIKTILIVVFFGGLLVLKLGLTAINSVDNTAVSKNNSAQESYQSGGDPEQAIAQLKQATQDAVTDSTKMTTRVNLAYVYSSEGKRNLALNSFKEALSFASRDSVDYHLISGEIALLESDPALALSEYGMAYEKDPNDFQVNNALNLFYLDLQDERSSYSDIVKALNYAIKANQIQPSDITRQNLGIAYCLNEKYAQAVAVLSSISNISSQPFLAYWLGLSYIGDDQPVNAKFYLKIAINGGVPVPQEIKDYTYAN